MRKPGEPPLYLKGNMGLLEVAGGTRYYVRVVAGERRRKNAAPLRLVLEIRDTMKKGGEQHG